jgi:uncharacterized protein
MESSPSGAGAPTTTTAPQTIAAVAGHVWSWNREPLSQRTADRTVTWTCPGATDFWRTTEGTPIAHNGCSLLTLVEGDFELEVAISGSFTDRYDQAGLMVVSSELRWLKAGVEVDGEPWLSAVHTREESDWSRESWSSSQVHLRALRHEGSIEVDVEQHGGWRNYRTLYLPGPVGIGLYSCAPKGAGFETTGEVLNLKA